MTAVWIDLVSFVVLSRGSRNFDVSLESLGGEALVGLRHVLAELWRAWIENYLSVSSSLLHPNVLGIFRLPRALTSCDSSKGHVIVSLHCQPST
jgi:hypothetical protein